MPNNTGVFAIGMKNFIALLRKLPLPSQCASSCGMAPYWGNNYRVEGDKERSHAQPPYSRILSTSLQSYLLLFPIRSLCTLTLSHPHITHRSHPFAHCLLTLPAVLQDGQAIDNELVNVRVSVPQQGCQDAAHNA